MKRAPLLLLLALAACNGGAVKESDEAAIANQAESLERAANATTDQLIKQMEDDASAEQAQAAASMGDASAENGAKP